MIERRSERHGKAHFDAPPRDWVLSVIGLTIGAAIAPGVTLSSFWAGSWRLRSSVP